MNIALLVEPHQVQDALISIAGVQEVGLPEGSALHVFVADERTAARFSNPAEVPFTLHIFDNPDEAKRYPLAENLLFAFCMQTFADNGQATLVLKPGTSPADSADISELDGEYNNAAAPTLGYPGDTKSAPRYGIFGAGFWHYSTGTRFLFGKGTPTYTEKIVYDCGPPYRTSETLAKFLSHDTVAIEPAPAAVATPAKKGVKKVRMKVRSGATVS